MTVPNAFSPTPQNEKDADATAAFASGPTNGALLRVRLHQVNRRKSHSFYAPPPQVPLLTLSAYHKIMAGGKDRIFHALKTWVTPFHPDVVKQAVSAGETAMANLLFRYVNQDFPKPAGPPRQNQPAFASSVTQDLRQPATPPPLTTVSVKKEAFDVGNNSPLQTVSAKKATLDQPAAAETEEPFWMETTQKGLKSKAIKLLFAIVVILILLLMLYGVSFVVDAKGAV